MFEKIQMILMMKMSAVFTQVSVRGAHLILNSQRRRSAYLTQALFRGRRSLNISKRHQNTFNLSLKSNNKNSNNNRRIEYLMFKIVCKTPLYTKEKQNQKLNQKRASFQRKMGALSSIGALSSKYGISNNCISRLNKEIKVKRRIKKISD